MIVPSISILALATVALGSAPQGMANYKRQATSSAAYASPSQALAASVKANANIAAIIVAIVASAQAAASVISSISAASVARTATKASATSSMTASMTSSGGQPAATCFDKSAAIDQIPTILGAASASGVCSSSCASFAASANSCYTSYTTNTALARCLCASSNLSSMFNCSGCEDSMDTDGNEGYYSNRAVSFCNQCITVGFQSTGVCGEPIQQGNPSLPACPTPSASASASATASATLSFSQSASATPSGMRRV